MPHVTLLTRPGCHLCDDARTVVASVVDAVPAATLDEQSIEDDPALLAAYTDDVPVVLIDGRWHGRWRIDAAALRAALADDRIQDSHAVSGPGGPADS